MTPSQDELLTRIEGFSFDEPGTVFTFAQRLARENGWAADYTRRVLREYGRFVFLALEAGHPVCPSEDVDQAWHQHLTFTQNYWEDFCGKVLERPLHHGPTRGGKAEAVKHHDMYGETLAAYRAWFGEEPPADIWPASERRFGDGGNFVRVNRREVWLIPKPRWLRPAALWVLALLVVGALGFAGVKATGMLAGASVAEVPIFDLPGQDFLLFFAIALALAMVVVAVIRSHAARVARVYSSQNTLTDPYLIATLTGGPNLAVYAAISELVRRGLLTASGPESISRVAGATDPGDLHPFEQAVWKVVPGMISTHHIRRLVEVETGAMRRVLEQGEFILKPEQQASVGRHTAAVFGIVLGIGLVKLVVGLSRERPVMYLVLMLLGTAVAWLAFRRKVVRTSLGQEALAALRSKYTIRGVHTMAFETTSPEAGVVPLAVALYGLPILWSSPLSALESSLVPPEEYPQHKHTRSWPGGCSTGGSMGGSSGCSGGGNTGSGTSGCSGGHSSGCSSGGSSGCSSGGSGCSSGCGGCGGGGH